MKKYILNCILFVLFSAFVTKAQNIDSLKLALKNAKHDTTRCNILSAMIEAENDDAIWPKYNEELLKLSESKLKTINKASAELKFYKRCYAEALSNVGYVANLQGNVNSALDYWNKSFKIQEEIGDKVGMANTLINIGSIYDGKGDIAKALECYNKNLKIMEELGDKKGMANAYNNMGVVYNLKGDIGAALNYFDKSLKIKEEIGDKSGIAYLFTNIGSIYQKQDNIPKALEYYNKGLKIREEIGDKLGVSTSLHNIGAVYYNQHELAKAQEYYERAMKYSAEIGYKSGYAQALNGIGLVAKLEGNMPKAIEYLTKSLKIKEEIGDKNGIIVALINIGGLYLKQKNYPKALEYCNKAMQVSKELESPEFIKWSAEYLCKINQDAGNYKQAFENYQIYIQMRDSINNIETQKAAILQQTNYEYEKKKAIEDSKHAAELKVQDEKAQADKKRQYIIIASVSIVLLLVAVFSILLYNRFKTTQKQKQIIELKEKETQHQKEIIEEKQKEIVDSINYAKRIQYTLLAHADFLNENLPQHFTYFNPKDIVSGDFYWATKQGDNFYLAVCDSTGHGVPGAFMSLLNIGFLTEAINEKGIEKPNEVFDYVRMRLTNTISKEGQKDGFDGILICVNQVTKNISYAAANNNPVIIKAGQVVELAADRMPVGVGERKENFTLHKLDSEPGDMLFLYTDGYADQFGGPKGKKFKYKQLNDVLIANSTLALDEQHVKLKTIFDNWRGTLEQVDDVCIIGIRL